MVCHFPGRGYAGATAGVGARRQNAPAIPHAGQGSNHQPQPPTHGRRPRAALRGIPAALRGWNCSCPGQAEASKVAAPRCNVIGPPLKCETEQLRLGVGNIVKRGWCEVWNDGPNLYKSAECASVRSPIPHSGNFGVRPVRVDVQFAYDEGNHLYVRKATVMRHRVRYVFIM